MPDALIAGVHEFPERKTAKSALEIQTLSARAVTVPRFRPVAEMEGF